MDKNAAASLDALDKKIESLLAKKELVLKKERERKAKAQEKWKSGFQKEIMKGIAAVYGPDYEEILFPEECAANIVRLLGAEQEKINTEGKAQKAGQLSPASSVPEENTGGKGEPEDE